MTAASKSRLAAVMATKPKPRPIDMADDRRWSQRRRHAIPAYLVSDRMQQAAPALVRDMSSTGAKVELKAETVTGMATTAGIPENFVLVLSGDGIEFDCEVVWREPACLGVRFLRGSRVMTKRPKPKPQVMPPKKKSWLS